MAKDKSGQTGGATGEHLPVTRPRRVIINPSSNIASGRFLADFLTITEIAVLLEEHTIGAGFASPPYSPPELLGFFNKPSTSRGKVQCGGIILRPRSAGEPRVLSRSYRSRCGSWVRQTSTFEGSSHRSFW